MFFRMSSIIIPSIYSTQSRNALRVDFPSSAWYIQSIFQVCVSCLIFPRHLTISFPYGMRHARVLIFRACVVGVQFLHHACNLFRAMVCAMLTRFARWFSVYHFSVHAQNLESLIKRFIFPFKGIFSALPIRTSDMRLSSDTRHLSS